MCCKLLAGPSATIPNFVGFKPLILLATFWQRLLGTANRADDNDLQLQLLSNVSADMPCVMNELKIV